MWSTLQDSNKAEYKKMILAFASLTELFAQKADTANNTIITPIINSKYQETVFQKVFNASAEDIGNTSYDASVKIKDELGVERKYLIGIKTFGYNADAQKVAQFKANHDEWATIINEIKNNAEGCCSQSEINEVNKELYEKLAKNIARIRNMRIDSSASNIQGFSILEGTDNVYAVYHVLMPNAEGCVPKIHVGETSYDKINIDKITVLGCTSKTNPTNFSFEDGNHKYKYTSADSQLYMYFNNQGIVQESWNVRYADDAYSIMAGIAEQLKPQTVEEVVESHTWRIDVQPYSGFNSFYGLSSKCGPTKRKKRIDSLSGKYNNISNDQMQELCRLLYDLNDNSKPDADRIKCRDQALELAKEYNDADLQDEVRKIVFRPKEELYIPIPNSKEFHTSHPDFFKKGLGKLKDGKLPNPKEENNFTLVLEPSKEELECFITQDFGKAIESQGKQSLLGEWLLRKIFVLNEFEPLTEKRLKEVGINAIRMYKTKDKKIHLQFIWID